MGKYYVFECDPEMYDYQLYYDESMAKEDHVIWYGGDYTANDDILSDIDKSFEDLEEDITHDNNNIDDEDDLLHEIETDIRNYFHKDNGKPLTNKDVNTIYNLYEEYEDGISDWDPVYCEVLEVIYDEPFISGTMRGSSQGDWAKCIMPESNKGSWDYIEAVWFATGTEYSVCIEETDTPEESIESGETVSWYTPLWREDNIIEAISKDFGLPKDKIEIVKKD